MRGALNRGPLKIPTNFAIRLRREMTYLTNSTLVTRPGASLSLSPSTWAASTWAQNSRMIIMIIMIQ